MDDTRRKGQDEVRTSRASFATGSADHCGDEGDFWGRPIRVPIHDVRQAGSFRELDELSFVTNGHCG